MDYLAGYNVYSNMLCEHSKIDLDKSCTASQNITFMYLLEALIKLGIDNPIPKDESGYSEYEDMIYFYDIWPKEKHDCAFRKRIMYAGYQLCELHPTNIFAKYIEKQDDKQNEKTIETPIDDNNSDDDIVWMHKNGKRVFGVKPQKGETK